MRHTPRLLLSIFALLLAAACAEEAAEQPPCDVNAPNEECALPDPQDICEEAARYRESCVGDYITPPICDEDAIAAAEMMLGLSCEQLRDPGKADGAFCDWFGVGCTPDEPIFDGPACTSDDVCGEGFCVEGHCFGGVGSDDLTRMLDTWTDTTEETGSATHLLVKNSETRALRRQLIESAQHSLHFSAFIIEEDETGEEMATLFAEAAQRGVEVRVVVDASTQYTFSSYDVLWKMRDAGVQILVYNAALEWAGLRLGEEITANDRLHEKLLIVDGAEAIMGGRNVGADYLLDGQWRDTDVYVTGPGVAGIQRMYLGLWDKDAAWEREAGCPNQDKYDLYCPDEETLVDNFMYYPPLDEVGTARTRAIYSDPAHQPTPHGYLATLALVRSARSSITIANSYFVPPRRLRKHLLAAVKRGVRVTVLTNSKESTDAWWMYYASLNYYQELIGGGLEIHQYRGTETMHAKTMLIDDELAVVGSFNLDPRSAVDNTESMLIIRDGDAVQELRDAMDADLEFSDLASDDISLIDKAKAKAFRLVEPLL